MNSRTAEVIGVKDRTVTFRLEDGRTLALRRGDQQLRHVDRDWAFDAFARKTDQPLGRSAESIAKSLGNISYAEAEEFCHDIRRRLALSPGEGSVKAVVAEQLALWKARAR